MELLPSTSSSSSWLSADEADSRSLSSENTLRSSSRLPA